MIRPSILDSEFNILFPYQTFPWRLEFDKTVCHFECEEHLQKYLDRYKLKPKHYKVSNRDGKSLKSSQKHKKDISKRSGGSNNRSSGTSKRRTSRVDSVRNTVSSTKRKK